LESRARIDKRSIANSIYSTYDLAIILDRKISEKTVLFVRNKRALFDSYLRMLHALS